MATGANSASATASKKVTITASGCRVKKTSQTSQPLARRPWRTQARHAQVGTVGLSQQDRILAAVPGMAGERPHKERVAAQELAAPCLSIAAPQFLSRDDALERAAQELP